MNDVYLVSAGVIGMVVSLVHGVLMQKLMIRPISAILMDGRVSIAARGLLSPLMHLSTAAWFLGGGLLVAVVVWPDAFDRFTVCVVVSFHYLYGAVFNFIGTRGRHPGWVCLMLSVLLIFLGLEPLR